MQQQLRERHASARIQKHQKMTEREGRNQQNGRKTEGRKERKSQRQKEKRKKERYVIVLEGPRNMHLQKKKWHNMITKRPVWDDLHLENPPKDTKSHSGSNPDPPNCSWKGLKSLKWGRTGAQRVRTVPQVPPKGSPKGSKNEPKTVPGLKNETQKKRKVKSC